MKMLEESGIVHAGALKVPGSVVLSSATPGHAYLIMRVEGDQSLRGKMISLGLVPGTSISVLSGGGGRPMLLEIGCGKYVLDVKSAGRIMVRRLDDRDRGGLL
jgi:Fe2+ transport system protein FeoA